MEAMEAEGRNDLLAGYIPANDAARELNTSRSTLWRLRKKIPYYRIAGRIYYKLADLRAYRDAQVVEPSSR